MQLSTFQDGFSVALLGPAGRGDEDRGEGVGHLRLLRCWVARWGQSSVM